jgi:DNA-binding MarR family transcriptional regulator
VVPGSRIVKYLDNMTTVSPLDESVDGPLPARAFALSLDAPTGDWRLDVDRPPLGSLTAMLFRALVDRLEVHITEQGGQVTRPSHLYILRSLYPAAATVTELAERCEVTKQAISQILDSLESMKVVKRTPDPRDARAKVVKLTKKGERSLEIAVLAWGEVENEWAKLLGGPAAMQEVREAMFAFIEKYGDWHRGEQPRLRPVW